MKFAAKTVAACTLPAGKTDAISFDDSLPGFGLRLRQGAGGKVLRSWIVQYRRGGATRRLLLGSADVLAVEHARAAAKRVLAQVALGEDPQAERMERRKKDRDTLQSVIASYLDAQAKKVQTKTLHDLTRYLLTGPAFKPLHAMPVDKITRKDVANRIVFMEREAGSIIAGRCRTALSTFFTWAMGMGLTDVNPVIATFRPQDSKPRERVLQDHELAKIWRACRDDDRGRIVKLLILLGARRREVGGMRWSEIDDKGSWQLPAERCKNGKPHELPLPALAFNIIKAVPRQAGRDHLFGARSHRGFSAWDKCKRALDARVGFDNWRLHDLRRTLSTRLHDLGVAPHVVEQVLNHQAHRGSVGGVYNKSKYEREVRAALALWSDHVRTLVEGGERKLLAYSTAAS